MRMTYDSGRSSFDDLFDQPRDIQIAHVARYLDLDLGNPLYWPFSVIDHLLAIRRHEGRDYFFREIRALLTYPRS
jgi:hypothetical protein